MIKCVPHKERRFSSFFQARRIDRLAYKRNFLQRNNRIGI